MRLERFCSLNVHYHPGMLHIARPYGNESGLAWGTGEGTVSGDRLAGTLEWSNQPSRRGDGTMLPNLRGVIKTDDGAEVFVELTGRTVFPSEHPIGHQLLMTLFESADRRYGWLNNEVCMAEGLQVVPSDTMTFRLEVYLCRNELT